MFKKIPGNVWQGSGECSRRFRGMFEKILRNGGIEMFENIAGNVQKIPGNV